MGSAPAGPRTHLTPPSQPHTLIIWLARTVSLLEPRAIVSLEMAKFGHCPRGKRLISQRPTQANEASPSDRSSFISQGVGQQPSPAPSCRRLSGQHCRRQTPIGAIRLTFDEVGHWSTSQQFLRERAACLILWVHDVEIC